MDLAIDIIRPFALGAVLWFILVGWGKIGYRDGGTLGFHPNAKVRGVVSMIFGLAVFLSVILIQRASPFEIGSSQEDNNKAFGCFVLQFFPWIYLPIINLGGALLKAIGWKRASING